jgi:hypothetical protein
MRRWPLALPILVLVLYASPCLPAYTIPAQVLSQAGGTAANADYNLLYTAGQASPPAPGSTSMLTVLPGFFPTLRDLSPPVISHEPVLVATRGMDVDIDVTVIDVGAGIDSVSLHYRMGGSRDFTALAMMAGEGASFMAAIPAPSVTEQGIAYYVEAEDRNGNTSCFPAGAPDSLLGLKVAFRDLRSTPEVPARSYRMISLPGAPLDGDPDTVLLDDLGTYDIKTWRLGRWNPSDTGCADYCYDEYPDIADFEPGKAFWLITGAVSTFDFSGISMHPLEPVPVTLEQGWNQIATPFAFATDLEPARIAYAGEIYTLNTEHIVGPDTLFVKADFIGYDGEYRTAQAYLEPWKGYWLYNESTVDVDLALSPEPAAVRLAGAPDGPEIPWLLRIRARCGELSGTIEAGLSPEARDGWDALDLRLPPPIGDYLRVAFLKDTWGRHSGHYMTDIRQAGTEGATWYFTVTSSEPRAASLDLEAAIGLSEDWEVIVYDPAGSMYLKPHDLPHRFELERARDFVLIAGNPDYVSTQEEQHGIDLRTQIVSVAPNPFSLSAEISFFLASRQRTGVTIYSVDGRFIARLVDCELDPGLHTIRWDGLDRGRRGAAPGIYFLRLETPSETLTSKILKVR